MRPCCLYFPAACCKEDWNKLHFRLLSIRDICIHLYSGFRSLVFKIVKFHNLGHDKSFLKIRVNLSRCLRRFRTPLKMLRETIVNKEWRGRVQRVRSFTWIVHALTSSWPAVKKYCNCNALYPWTMILSRALEEGTILWKVDNFFFITEKREEKEREKEKDFWFEEGVAEKEKKNKKKRTRTREYDCPEPNIV